MELSKKELKQLSKKQLIEIIFELLPLKDKVKELERLLLAYENAHTPPSKSKKKEPKKESKGNLGAQKGHPKWERTEPEPTSSVEYIEKGCPHCNSELGEPFKTDRFLEEDIPEPQPVEVIEHLINHYICPNCKKHIIAGNHAPQGRFGKNALTHITLLKYEDRLPLRKVVSSLERHYNLKLTNVGVFNITKRVARKLKGAYKLTILSIRQASVIYADETELKVDGITYYLWTFVSDSEVIFVIRRSRAKEVIEEILGANYKGVICCDGWTAYSNYSTNLQRCWAHLMRESKDLANKYTEFQGFHNAFKSMFEKIKQAREKPPPLEKRIGIREKLRLEMNQLIEQMLAYKEFEKFATKVKNGLNYWFTCVVNLLVEPTNNIAERALRELIVQRKIIGGLRREKGAGIMETITSMIATWKLRDKPIFQTMKSYL